MAVNSMGVRARPAPRKKRGVLRLWLLGSFVAAAVAAALFYDWDSGALGLLLGAWGVTGLVTTALSPLFDDALSNQSHDTHVPAYFVIYGLVLAAVTAVNEEVVVNGYLLTRLAQLGWRPWPALGLSLALRTSYHVYYGAALLATVPIGYFVSRSFQKHRRLGRPIIVHFVYDAVLLTVAVLAS